MRNLFLWTICMLTRPDMTACHDGRLCTVKDHRFSVGSELEYHHSCAGGRGHGPGRRASATAVQTGPTRSGHTSPGL